MSITTQERPGVYSSYAASSLVFGSGAGKVVGLVGLCPGKDVGVVKAITRQEEATAAYGADSELTQLAGLALRNGASALRVVAVENEAGYAPAFAVLEQEESVGVLVCDATSLAVQQALRDSAQAASDNRKERIAVVPVAAGETVTQVVERAGELNHPRVVLAAPVTLVGGARGAAALAGAIAGTIDPAVPLGGAVLDGLEGLAASYTESEIDQLIRGGVTPLEQSAGQTLVVRGITTKTTTGDSPDTTWRELSSILIVDDVIPTLRNSLKAKFQRAKNTEQSRGAIRAQTILELEQKKTREIITGYDGVAVTPMEDNPTVCQVEFAFTVAHGLNQIWLSAHVTL